MRGAAIACIALAALGCESVIGAEFDDVRAKRSCDSIVPPDPPSVQNAPADLTLTALITTVDYGELPGTNGYQQIGWDLDQRCTNVGDRPECMPEPWTKGDPSDGPNGQDNAIGKILSLQESLFGIQAITSESESSLMKQGKRAPFALLRISGFTGFPEDPKVRVEWYSAVAFERAYPGQAPKLDGTDAWPIAKFDDAPPPDGGALDAGLLDAGTSLPPDIAIDDAAYVTQSVLVANFAKLRVPLANVFFEVEKVVLSGTLAPDRASATRRLTGGMVGGISPADQLLHVIPRITASVFSLPLCTDDDNYLIVKRYVCSGADIPLAPLGEDKVCTGASFGVRFETHPVEVGPTLVVNQVASLCPGKDSIDDRCSIPVPDSVQAPR